MRQMHRPFPAFRCARALGLAAALLAAASPAFAQDSPQTKTVLQGGTNPLGAGTVQAWVELDDTGVPIAIGVTMSEGATTELPHEELLFAADLPEVEGLPFEHVYFDWMPHGHEPDPLYGRPHFDAHFYLIPEHERRAIVEELQDTAPAPGLIPDGFLPDEPEPGAGFFSFPQMGVHWVDETARELQGQTFTETLIYGSHEGRVVFIEPMFTLDFLESGPELTAPVPQPEAVSRSGYYPRAYSIRQDENGGYRISLEDFVWREARGG